MNVERLKALSDFLRTPLVMSHFDIETWVSVEDDKDYNGGDFHRYLNPKKLHCGTTACALGWACTLFRGEGIHLNRYGLVRMKDQCYKCSYKVGAEFFDVPLNISQWLFNPDSYYPALDETGTWDVDDLTSEEVADRIDYLLEHGVQGVRDRGFPAHIGVRDSLEVPGD